MRGVVTPILGLLAVACIVLGVLNATIWKPSRQISASADITGSRYIVTDPGVLPLLDDNAELNVTSNSDDDMCVALASAKDAAGWVASSDGYMRITGMESWSALQTKKDKPSTQTAAAEDAQPVSFQDSDMWKSVVCDSGEVSLNSKSVSDSTVAIVDLGEEEPHATVTMRWTRQHVPDFAMPFYLVGGLSAVLAVFSASVFAMAPHKRRKRLAVTGETTQEAAAAEAGSSAVFSPKSVKSVGKPKRRRHASHRRGGKPSSVAGSSASPEVIDPAARNLVADQEEANRTAQSGAPLSDGETTSVITPEDLQAYFARLAQEVGPQMPEESASLPNDGDASDKTGGSISPADGEENTESPERTDESGNDDKEQENNR